MCQLQRKKNLEWPFVAYIVVEVMPLLEVMLTTAIPNEPLQLDEHAAGAEAFGGMAIETPCGNGDPFAMAARASNAAVYCMVNARKLTSKRGIKANVAFEYAL